MNRKPVCFEVTLNLLAPVLSKTADTAGIGLDAGMLGDPQGAPAFHFTHIKGQLRQAWCELQRIGKAPDEAFIERWLGAKSAQGNYEPVRGELAFDAYWAAAKPAKGSQAPHRYRVRIDETTGAAAQGALMVIESPWPSGAEVKFRGSIHARVTDDEHDQLKHWLNAGFNMIPALGALKGNGFGRLQRADIVDHDGTGKAQSLDSLLNGAQRFGLRIKPLDPFCFARVATGKQNHFASEEQIPGSALIAAIAARCKSEPKRFPLLQQALAVEGADGGEGRVALTLTHARPVRDGGSSCPVAIPLSLVNLDPDLRDISDRSQPGRIDGRLPTFPVDWKEAHWQTAQQALNPDNPGQDKPAKRLLIRTAIDPQSGTSAENQLFSMQTVLPGGCDWLANLSLDHCADPAGVLEELADLFAEPLTHLGKSKARAKVTLSEPFAPGVSRHPVQGDSVTVHLQSPAALLPDDFQAPSSGGTAVLEAAYDQSWRSISAHSLSLSHFFAAQQLYGGNLWWSRNRPGGPYRPRVMTLTGSVFVLRIEDPSKANDLLADWERNGLPQPDGVRGGEDWRRNPWIRANGYGEILLNPDINGALNRGRS